MSTSSSSEISANVFKSGWILLVHHFDTVAWSFPNCSASHLFVFWCSTSTTFSRFRILFITQNIGIWCKNNNISWNNQRKLAFFINKMWFVVFVSCKYSKIRLPIHLSDVDPHIIKEYRIKYLQWKENWTTTSTIYHHT